MKVRIKVRPSGLYNGAEWPAVGEVIELPDHVATGMLNSKLVTAVKRGDEVETATPDPKAQETATPARKNAKQVAAPTPAATSETPAPTPSPAAATPAPETK